MCNYYSTCDLKWPPPLELLKPALTKGRRFLYLMLLALLGLTEAAFSLGLLAELAVTADSMDDFNVESKPIGVRRM